MGKPFCVVGYYFTVESILKAAKHARSSKFKNFDTFTPFPIHGMEDAMGMKRSTLPYLSFIAAVIGFSLGAGLTIWTHLWDWPMNIAGKPNFALPAYIPIIFETTVLVCGVTTALLMFGLYLKLPNFSKKPFHPDITNDRFALAVQVPEDQIDAAVSFLKEINAKEIRHVEGTL